MRRLSSSTHLTVTYTEAMKAALRSHSRPGELVVALIAHVHSCHFEWQLTGKAKDRNGSNSDVASHRADGLFFRWIDVEVCRRFTGRMTATPELLLEFLQRRLLLTISGQGEKANRNN